MRQPQIRETVSDLAALIGRLTELNGRVSEISNRIRQDALQLAELQQEVSVTLSRVWALRDEKPPAPILPSAQRILRQAEVIKRVGLARSTIWKMVKEGQFPSPRRLSPGAI